MGKTFILTLGLLFLTFSNAQKVALKLDLKKGEEYKQHTYSEATIVQEVNGLEMNFVVTVKGSMSYLVKEVNDQGYDMDVKYEKLSMSMQLPQGSMEFSSESSDEQDIFSKMLAQMKNKPFQVTMTSKGKITEVKNIEMLFESVFNYFPEIPESQMAQMKDQLMNAYGAKALKGSIEMVTAIYPDQTVAKGESWLIETKLESGMSADMTTTYKFTEDNPDYYLIVGDSKIQTADKDAYIESNGMPMKYDLTGNMSSEIKVDKVSGWIIKAEIKQEIEGDAYIKRNQQIPEDMKIPMLMKNHLIFTN